ncbi:MAG: hypothetical protein ACTSWY_12925 [Promethearchaeota archaeon]
MALSKRERMLKFLDLDDEPDKCPVFTFGFEPAGFGMKQYIESDTFKCKDNHLSAQYLE